MGGFEIVGFLASNLYKLRKLPLQAVMSLYMTLRYDETVVEPEAVLSQNVNRYVKGRS